MREINLDRLRTLLTVADLGSFAAAAKVLHLAPPPARSHTCCPRHWKPWPPGIPRSMCKWR